MKIIGIRNKRITINFLNLFDSTLLILTSILLSLVDNDINSLYLIGILLIFFSIYLCLKTRKNKLLFLLFAILAYINISIAVNDLIYMGVNVSSWQFRGLRQTVYNAYTAKSILVTLSIVNMFINKEIMKCNYEYVLDNGRKNSIISSVGLIVLFMILIYGVFSLQGIRGEYVSVTSPIYEYSIVVLCIVWYYSRVDNVLIKMLIHLYALTFSGYFLFIGDRSSVFMLIVLMFILFYQEKISINNIVILSIVGTMFSNLIAIFRNNQNISFIEIAGEIIERGLYSDTVSWAYYASISISALNEYVVESYKFIFGYLISIFTWIKPEYGNMALYARTNFNSLFNNGGGIYSSFFYGMSGYFGVVLGAIILGIIIKKVYLSNSRYSIVYKILMPTLAFRWYLYSPVTLFRGLLVLTTLLLILCELFNKLTWKMN